MTRRTSCPYLIIGLLLLFGCSDDPVSTDNTNTGPSDTTPPEHHEFQSGRGSVRC